MQYIKGACSAYMCSPYKIKELQAIIRLAYFKDYKD